MYENFDYVAKKYPVALYINPEASQRQLKDFISKNWDQIKMHRKKGQGTFGNIRKRNKQLRNDFIYENRELPLVQIREKLRLELGEFLDDGLIGKIIQLEKKKRN